MPTYYVKSGGDDGLSGLSDALAWATISKVQSTVTSGDTIYFRSQDTWSGSSGDYVLSCVAGVTYDGSTYGSGTKATITRSNQNIGVIDFSQSNVTFTGFNVDGNNVGANCIEINYNNRSSAISNVTIDNCAVHDNYNESTTWYGIVIASVSPWYVSNVTITNTSVYNMCHEGIAIYAGTASADTLSSVIVRGCTIYSCGLYGDSWGAGILIKNNTDGVVLEFNTIYANAFGVEFETAGEYSPTNITVRYNIIRGNRFGFYILSPGATRVYGVSIYGNLFITNGRSGDASAADIYFEGQTQGSSVWNIYNNTFYSIGMLSGTDYCLRVGCSGTPTITVKNNIFYTDNHAGITDLNNKIGSNHGYNIFYLASGNVVDSASSYTMATVGSWGAGTDIGDDPEFTGGTLPTIFSGTYGTDMVPDTDYFVIPVGKPPIDAGTNLGSTYNGAINLSGISGGLIRPQPVGGSWDIGAYEYYAAGGGTLLLLRKS